MRRVWALVFGIAVVSTAAESQEPQPFIERVVVLTSPEYTLHFINGDQVFLWGVQAIYEGGSSSTRTEQDIANGLRFLRLVYNRVVSCIEPAGPPYRVTMVSGRADEIATGICSFSDKSGEHVDLGEWLVENGYAQYVTYLRNLTTRPTVHRPY